MLFFFHFKLRVQEIVQFLPCLIINYWVDGDLGNMWIWLASCLSLQSSVPSLISSSWSIPHGFRHHLSPNITQTSNGQNCCQIPICHNMHMLYFRVAIQEFISPICCTGWVTGYKQATFFYVFAIPTPSSNKATVSLLLTITHFPHPAGKMKIRWAKFLSNRLRHRWSSLSSTFRLGCQYICVCVSIHMHVRVHMCQSQCIVYRKYLVSVCWMNYWKYLLNTCYVTSPLL